MLPRRSESVLCGILLIDGTLATAMSEWSDETRDPVHLSKLSAKEASIQQKQFDSHGSLMTFCVNRISSQIWITVPSTGALSQEQSSGDSTNFRRGPYAQSLPPPPNCKPKRKSELGTLPLPKSITYNMCKALHEHISRKGPTILELQMLGCGRHTRARDNKVIKLEFGKTLSGRNSLYSRTAKLSNCLPKDVRTTESVPLFKMRLKECLSNSVKERFNYFWLVIQ